MTVNLGFVEGEEVLHLTFDEAQNQFLPLVDELLSVHTASALGLEEATEFRVTNVVLSRAEAWQLIETMWDIIWPADIANGEAPPDDWEEGLLDDWEDELESKPIPDPPRVNWKKEGF